MLETSRLSSNLESSDELLMSSLESSHFVRTTRIKLNLFYYDSSLSNTHCQCLVSSDQGRTETMKGPMLYYS